jgi:hypothetical protein
MHVESHTGARLDCKAPLLGRLATAGDESRPVAAASFEQELSPAWEAALQRFQRELKTRGSSPHTLRA